MFTEETWEQELGEICITQTYNQKLSLPYVLDE